MTQTNAAGPPASAVATEPAVHAKNQFLILVIGAIGVVYGDIGTSPLYAFREALHVSTGTRSADRGRDLGLLSLIVWTLIISSRANTSASC